MHGICPEPKMTKFYTEIIDFDDIILKPHWHCYHFSYSFLIRTKITSTLKRNFMFLNYICQFRGSRIWVQTGFRTFRSFDLDDRPQKQHF